MADPMAPGAYAEEVAFRSREIVGVPTATTAFVGPTLKAPEGDDPSPPLTSFTDYAWRYGAENFVLEDGGVDYLAHAAHAFFAAGGRRLHVARVGSDAGLPGYEAALAALDAVEDIALIAAPAAGAQAEGLTREIGAALIGNASGKRRFAVIDPPPGLSVPEILDFRRAYDNAHAALYYPWVVTADPRGGRSGLALPPSGAVCGLYARNDQQRSVWTAPAKLTVPDARDLEVQIHRREQENLAVAGVNCLRRFDGRGKRDVRIWSARTLGSDPEFRAVQVRRWMTWLEASLTRGLAWAAPEPNAAPLWAAVRQSVENLLGKAWREGALAGGSPAEAFFVKCGLGVTMTARDIEEKRLIYEVGVAMVRPAEFIVLQLTQTLEH